MAGKITNFKKNFSKLLLLRSDDYNQYGKYLVQDFTYKNIFWRLISLLGDVVVMILPIAVWLDIFLLVTAGLVPVKFLYAIMYLTLMLIILFTVVSNTYCSILFKGQSFGKVCMRFKVINNDNSECERTTIIIREVLGKEVPLVALYLLLGIKGILIFFVLDGLCVLIDKKHRSIIDIPLKTKVVMLSPMGLKHSIENVVPVAPPVEKKIKAENKIDLHIYSSFSHDGEYEVEDIFKLAKSIGLETISICDHNSIKANLIAKQVAHLYNINYVPGINIDCEYEGYHVRLLGYFINSNDERFTQIEYENLAKEKATSIRRVKLFEEFSGFKIDEDKLLRHNRFQIISGEMIARSILTNPIYKEESLIQPYLNGKKKDKPIQNFVDDFFKPGKVAYVPIIQPKLTDMIALVKATGGVCVLAHPMDSLRDNPKVIEDIIKEGIEGIEIFNPKHSSSDMKYLIDLAKKYSLSVTSGSEFHGKQKKNYVLGKTSCPKDAEIIIQRFYNKYK